MAETEAVKRFVRQTLGCNCADEVFAKIECQREPFADGTLSLRLVIGARLLVWAIFPVTNDAAQAGLARWVAAGIALRDAHGLNRFRLVLGLAQPRSAEDILRASFASLTLPDDRIHLHVLDTAALEVLGEEPC